MKVEIEAGKTAVHFRAYGPVKLTRAPTLEEHMDRGRRGLNPFKPGEKVIFEGEDVVIEDEVDGASVRINAKGKKVTRIVFYAGKADEAVVVGSAELSGGGPFDLELVEAAA